MEVLRPQKVNYEEAAMRVFMESINLLGGLKRIIQFRNLTWVPSLAEAAYVIVLKNEGMKGNKEIAAELGITEETVRKVLRAKSEEVEHYIKGEKEEIDEHIAGGIAKLAYEKLKREGKLEFAAEIGEAEARELELAFDVDIFWALRVMQAIKGLKFPVGREELAERVSGIEIRGVPIVELLNEISFPVRTPAELLHKLKEARKTREIASKHLSLEEAIERSGG